MSARHWPGVAKQVPTADFNMTQPERRLKRECLRQKAGDRKKKAVSRMAESRLRGKGRFRD